MMCIVGSYGIDAQITQDTRPVWLDRTHIEMSDMNMWLSTMVDDELVKVIGMRKSFNFLK